MMLRFLFLFVIALLAMPGAILAAPDSLSVMSFNIRYANPADGEYLWAKRADRVCDAINEYGPDIVGTQEVLHGQLMDMKRRLPEYINIGVARDDGRTQGEYAALWYRKDRFVVADSGNFWLSATPREAGSLGWDGACVRIATWALLTDRASGKEILALNTHLDHVGPLARSLGARLIVSTLDSLRAGREIPVVVTGDFNSGPKDTVITGLTDPSRATFLSDARITAQRVAGPEWTFHDFGRLPYTERERIDYIFYLGLPRPISYTTLDSTDSRGLYLSDHCPIIAVFKPLLP